MLGAKGAAVGLPTLPLATSGNVVVQLANSAGAECWESVFTPATFRRNVALGFRAVSP